MTKWEGTKNGRITNTIQIKRQLVPISYFGRAEKLKYCVNIGYDVENDTKIVDRSEYFDKKSQAIKFAKEYMRKN